jgi:hypothetical protein
MMMLQPALVCAGKNRVELMVIGCKLKLAFVHGRDTSDL